MTQDEDRKLEELLDRMVPTLAEEDELVAAAAPEKAVSDELRARVLTRAETLTAELLAEAIISSAREHGKTVESLVAESGGPETEVRRLLEGRCDPRKLGVGVFARLLSAAGVDASVLRELIVQTVAQFVVVYPKKKRGFSLRAFASRGSQGRVQDRRTRDATTGRTAGALFADEVIAESARLGNGE
jgi:hypothetical protein